MRINKSTHKGTEDWKLYSLGKYSIAKLMVDVDYLIINILIITMPAILCIKYNIFH